jgi:predicted dehydrogenase
LPTDEDRSRPPSRTHPIYIVGAGSVVRDAHLPAYAQAGFRVGGLFDLDADRARHAAGIADCEALGSLEELLARCEAEGGVLDLALPPAALPAVLERVPRGTAVLMQKPFGRTLPEATALREIARARGLRGVVNFQLRHAPVVREARRLIDSGAIGDLVDFELRVVCRMPWETWPFLEGMERMEILMHAIHYLDLARAVCGEPDRVWSMTARHPAAPRLAETRSTTAMSFGSTIRAVVTTFHHHAAPPAHDASHVRIEGTRGTIVARLGVNLDYPTGRPDTLEVSREGGAWECIAVEGNWFPHAFAGPMRSLQRVAEDPSARVESNLDDAWRTMALVETCYKSAAAGERLPEPSR